MMLLKFFNEFASLYSDGNFTHREGALHYSFQVMICSSTVFIRKDLEVLSIMFSRISNKEGIGEAILYYISVIKTCKFL